MQAYSLQEDLITSEACHPVGSGLHQAKVMIDRFLSFIRPLNIGMDVIDVEELPMSKPALSLAFQLAIGAEAIASQRDQLARMGLFVATFQSGVGERISLRPVGTPSKISNNDVRRQMIIHRVRLLAIDRAFALVESERRVLHHLYQVADANAAQEQHAAHAINPAFIGVPFDQAAGLGR